MNHFTTGIASFLFCAFFLVDSSIAQLSPTRTCAMIFEREHDDVVYLLSLLSLTPFSGCDCVRELLLCAFEVSIAKQQMKFKTYFVEISTFWIESSLKALKMSSFDEFSMNFRETLDEVQAQTHTILSYIFRENAPLSLGKPKKEISLTWDTQDRYKF